MCVYFDYLLSRNEAYQEDMWSRTIELLKDHLSQETLDKYGSQLETAEAADQQEEANSGAMNEAENAEESRGGVVVSEGTERATEVTEGREESSSKPSSAAEVHVDREEVEEDTVAVNEVPTADRTT